MQVNNLPSTSFKGMIMLKDENGQRFSINPQGISTVTDLSNNRHAKEENKATRIDMINGGVNFTRTEYEELLSAIQTANKISGNIHLDVLV